MRDCRISVFDYVRLPERILPAAQFPAMFLTNIPNAAAARANALLGLDILSGEFYNFIVPGAAPAGHSKHCLEKGFVYSMDRFLQAGSTLLIVAVAFTVALWRYNSGPVIWYRKARGRSLALKDDHSRRELVERVRRILPQAGNGNVVFSLQVESHSSGGSRARVTTYTYHYKVFVADADCLWVVPFSYDKKKRSYELGQPVALTPDLLKTVSLAGKRGQSLEVSFFLKQEVGLNSVAMMLEPLQYRRNRFYPFDFLQEEACEKAMELTERMALAGCGQTAEDLEQSRLKDEGGKYATYAVMWGFCGIIAACVSQSLMVTGLFFAAALAMFGIMLSRKQIPKISLAVVIAEALLARLFLS